MKLAHWPKKILSLVVLVALGATAARGAIEMDDFGPPDQRIEITANSVAVRSPFRTNPPNNGAPLESDSFSPFGEASGTYSGPALGGDGTFASDATAYDGTASTFYSYASYTGMSGGVISSTPGGGLFDFSQRDAQLTLVGTPSPADSVNFSAGGLELSGLTGGGATLLLQYDGVDLVADVLGGTAFENGQRLGYGTGGLNLLLGGNDGFYFSGVQVNAVDTISTTAGVFVRIRVWTESDYGLNGEIYQEATLSFGDTNGGIANYAILFSAFNLGDGAVNFDQVTGVDIIFELESNEDIYLGRGPGGGLFVTNPEPATLAMWSLLSMGGLGLGYIRRRKLAA